MRRRGKNHEIPPPGKPMKRVSSVAVFAIEIMEEMHMKKGCALIWSLLFLIVLVGCAASQESQPVEETEVEYQQFSQKQENGKPNIYLITKGYNNFYWDTLRSGASDAAADLDCNLYVGGTPSESHLEILAQLTQEAIDAEADAIILSPADLPEIIEMTAQADKAGIPVIFVDTILNGQNFDICFATDNMEAGRMAAEEMLDLLKDAGKQEDVSLSVGIEIGMAESQTILERLAGFQEYWSDHAPEGWKVADEIKINQGNIDLARQHCYEFINTYENLAGVAGLNNGSTVGLARAIEASGRSDLVLVGFDYSEEMQRMIADERYHASTIVQRQYDMGYQSVESALQLAGGQAAMQRYVDTGVQTVRHDNVNSPYIQKILGQ